MISVFCNNVHRQGKLFALTQIHTDADTRAHDAVCAGCDGRSCQATTSAAGDGVLGTPARTGGDRGRRGRGRPGSTHSPRGVSHTVRATSAAAHVTSDARGIDCDRGPRA